MENKFNVPFETYHDIAYFAVYEMDDSMSDEYDHLENFNRFEDAVEFCEEYENNTHIVLMPEDDPDEEPGNEIWRDFYKRYGYDAYEVVAEFDKGKAQFSLDDD